ncbi:MAG: large conductance mechanosensitive channel protein MscL [Bacteroidetes bacterium]|nr:large conductance mechanosensitive channel protein MscL [Bacteroidota bacterium]
MTKQSGFIHEFREFALRGNLTDMAIAFVMGGAFTKLVTAFIDGLVMPLVGSLTAGDNFQSLKYVLNEATFDSQGNLLTAETAVRYGEFITVLLDFILVSFCVFLVVKMMNRARRKFENVVLKKNNNED